MRSNRSLRLPIVVVALSLLCGTLPTAQGQTSTDNHATVNIQGELRLVDPPPAAIPVEQVTVFLRSLDGSRFLSAQQRTAGRLWNFRFCKCASGTL